MNETSWKPNRKVWTGGLAAAVTFVGVRVAQHYGIEIDEMLGDALAVIVGYGVSYFVPEASA